MSFCNQAGLIIFILFGVLFPQGSKGQTHNTGFLSSINLGFRYSSVLAKRGAVFYDDFQIDPVLGLFFFDDRLEFLGDSLGYRDFILDDRVRLRTRVQAISDNPLFPAHRSIRSESDRSDTYEWINTIELFSPGYNESYQWQLDFTAAKDILVHGGHYFEILGKIKIFDFLFLATEIEPNLVVSYGAGDSSHNSYFYGARSEGRLIANSAVGVWFAFPKEADRFYPIVQLIRFSTHGLEKNSEGYLFSFIATFGLLD